VQQIESQLKEESRNGVRIPQNMDSVKGIIFDIKKYALHDGPGIRTTIFLKGCPMRCLWCHNPESQKSEPETMSVKIPPGGDPSVNRETVGRKVTVPEVMREIRKDLLFYDESGGGVTFSGGEPLMQLKFLAALLTASKQLEIRTALDTTGYAPWKDLEGILPLVDVFLYDLKFINNSLHQKYTGVSNRPVLENLQKLAQTDREIIIRIPIIPGITDEEKNLVQLKEFILSLNTIHRIDLLPYNFIAVEKYRKLNRDYPFENLDPPDEERMQSIRNKFVEAGFSVEIGG